MTDSLIPVVVALVGGFSCLSFLGLLALAFAWHRRRRDVRQAWALRRGMRFEAGFPKTAAGQPDPRLADVGPFPFFQPRFAWSHPHMWNLAHGVVGGAEVWLFDYSDDYDTDTEKVTVVCFRAPGLELPVFTLGPRLHLLGLSLGAVTYGQSSPDLVLGGAAFDQNYVLRGPDEGRVRNAFRPRVVAFFSQRSGWTVQGEADRLLVTRSGLDWEALADEARSVLEVFRGSAGAFPLA